MLNILKERQRRCSSSSKNKITHGLQQINLNIFQDYIPDQKSKQNNFGSRVHGKENKNRKSQQIKQFRMPGVKFKNNLVNCKQKIKEAEIKQKLSFKHLQAEDSSLKKIKNNLNFQIQETNQISNRKQVKMNDQNKQKLKNRQYSQRYQAAIAMIFKNLDIFNRGTITQTNINKWIPEQALYFLGKVFQKIRQQRLYLSYDQFLQHCLPILKESNEEDIKTFLQSVTGKDITHTISIDFPSQEKNNNQSPVQYKITKDTSLNVQNRKDMRLIQYQKSQYKPLVPCEDLIASIKQKQKILNQRLKLINEKQNIFNQRNAAIYSLNKNEQRNHMSSSKDKYSSKQNNNIKVSNFQSHKKCLSDLQKDQFKNGSDLRKNQFNFSFQLPDFKNYQNLKSNAISNTQNNQKLILKNEIKIQNDILNLQKIQKNPIQLRPSHIVRQSIASKQTLSNQKRQTEKQQDTQRINRLNSRLQEYIKFNKQKIEKNKRFIRQNSVPKA